MKLLGALVIICLIILATLFIKMSKENSKCINNPFVYGAEKTAEQGMEVTCSCTSLDPEYSGFYFDKNGLRIGDAITFDA